MKKSYKLVFPQSLIKEPVMFTMAKKYDVMPNIRRARVTDDYGEIVIDLEGSEENIKMAIDSLKNQGVEVEIIDLDSD